MTFLSPLFLWFLPLVALPVIIHLLAKRKSKLVEFPSLKFLKLLEQDALKKFNIKQLILLILRTLMILLIVLVFSRPNLNHQSRLSFSTAPSDLILIALDNTASNNARLNRSTGLWLDNFQSDLEEKGFTVLYAGITDFKLVDNSQQIEPTYKSIYSGDVQTRLSEQVDLDRYQQKSIIWIGDGQDAESSLVGLSEWDSFILHDPQSHDAGITALNLPERSIRQGEEYSLILTLVNSAYNQNPMEIQLQINESRQNQAIVEFDQNVVEMTAKVDDGGFQDGVVSLIPDDHPFNDSQYFILPAAGSIQVQILRDIQVLDYWKLMGEAIKEMGFNLNLKLLNYGEIDNLNLSQGGTVIIEDASKLAEYNWIRLKNFVEKGGQIITFGDGGEYLVELLGCRISNESETNRMPFGLYPVSGNNILDKPIIAAVEQNRLKIFKRFNVGSKELDDTWIRFLDDQPFLGSSSYGMGRTIWFNTQFSTDASNLPLLGMFPTLMVKLIESQNITNSVKTYNVFVGDTLKLYPQTTEGESAPFRIQRPDGTVDYQAPDSSYMIQYTNTNLPGIYHLLQGRKLLEMVAVNVSEHERMGHYGSIEISNPNLFVTQSKDDLAKEVMDRRAGVALWPILLSLILILWVIETYLSRIKSTWRQNV